MKRSHIVIASLVVMVAFFAVAASREPSAPATQKGGFTLYPNSDGYAVRVLVDPSSPEQFLQALSNAVKASQAKTGKKPAKMEIASGSVILWSE